MDVDDILYTSTRPSPNITGIKKDTRNIIELIQRENAPSITRVLKKIPALVGVTHNSADVVPQQHGY